MTADTPRSLQRRRQRAKVDGSRLDGARTTPQSLSPAPEPTSPVQSPRGRAEAEAGDAHAVQQLSASALFAPEPRQVSLCPSTKTLPQSARRDSVSPLVDAPQEAEPSPDEQSPDRQRRRRSLSGPPGARSEGAATSHWRDRSAASSMRSSYEQHALRSFRRSLSPHDNHMRSQLFDVDVLKKQTILNVRPKHRAKAARRASWRLLFFPFYYHYWCAGPLPRSLRLTLRSYCGAAALYLAQVVALVTFCTRADANRFWEAVEPFEVWFPVVLLGLLSILFGRTASGQPFADEKETGSSPPSGGDIADRESDAEDDESDLSEAPAGADPQAASPSDLASPMGYMASDSITSVGRDASAWTPLTAGGSAPHAQDAGDDIDEPFEEDSLNVIVFGPPARQGAGARPSLRAPRQTPSIQAVKQCMRVCEVRECILRLVDKRGKAEEGAGTVNLACAAACAVLPTLHRVVRHWPSVKRLVVSEGSPCAWLAAVFYPHIGDLVGDSQPSCMSEPEVQCTAAAIPVVLVCLSSAGSALLIGWAIFKAFAQAEIAYNKRYLYAKFFSALTSWRRSQRYGLPHFRLKNVENIRAWLHLRGSRAWLRLRPDELAADTVVSTCFQTVLGLVALTGVGLLGATGGSKQKGVAGLEQLSASFGLHHLVTFTFTMLVSYYLLRFMMLGTSINQKYANASVLLTEQLNVHLRIMKVTERDFACTDKVDRQKLKEKKEKLQNTQKVLDMAAKLLKELEGPNKISGLSMNPLLYNLTRVIVLSCFSAALSTVFGFSPKLWKL
eukprot:TRINITY_DN24570_c0_g1_i1.p1 TRINITY_DN24570_c0_g1~~TRINITY_DN24570_c0_g1_i1.p1  ORF type:complete len:785 (+),score=112.37 TRINITY_DN24570_c0_g1_i1:103-2457(+)